MPYLEAPYAVRWHYQEQGQGTCLLFLHGWASSSRVFSQQVEYFSKDYRVVTLDLPGHGKTAWAKLHFEQMVEGIKLLADHLNEQNILIVGSSLGGMIGLKCAEMFPALVEKLVMVGSLPRFIKTTEKPLGLSVPEMQKLQQQLDERYPAILDIFFRSLFTIQERQSPKFQWIHQFRQTGPWPDKEALAYFLEVLSIADLTDFLKIVRVPVLFLSGDQDYICPKDSFVFLKQLAPSLQYDFIKHSGHFPFLIYADAFNQKVERFLRS